ncbi:MAG: glucose-1-phosphate adenylyltransferase [Chlamydiales bacterium]|nr:glucose-1-phosphate adenylyltransferase [Chlamydiales bacterium]
MNKKTHIDVLTLLEKHQAATIILAGGQGTRLFPLTQTRCKPDVSFAGRYKLIDIPISNSINAKISKIFVISQYFASDLNNHIASTFHAGALTSEKIEMLSPEETPLKKSWYQGTADAVRKNLSHFLHLPIEYFIILSGDQLYNMDLIDMLEFTKEKDAELTIATIPVKEKEARRMGIMKINKNHLITDFYEKPSDIKVLKKFKVKDAKDPERCYLGSMGIYIFKKDTLIHLLNTDLREDFGKHIIPTQIKTGKKTAAYTYHGYWEDIGTVESFYEANLSLTTTSCGLDLYNEQSPIYAQNINLPSAFVKNTRVTDSIICDGSIINAKEITHSLIGLRSRIMEGTIIQDSIVIGNPSYTSSLPTQDPHDYFIGKNCIIKKAIIDEQTQIEDNVSLTNEKHIMHYDSDHLYVRDGIIVIPAGTHLPKNFRF